MKTQLPKTAVILWTHYNPVTKAELILYEHLGTPIMTAFQDGKKIEFGCITGMEGLANALRFGWEGKCKVWK